MNKLFIKSLRPYLLMSAIAWMCALPGISSDTNSPPANIRPAVRPVPPESRLHAVEFSSLTKGTTKQKDAAVYVYVTTAGGDKPFASIERADCADAEAREYQDGIYRILRLRTRFSAPTMHDCEDCRVKVKLKANGNNKWRFDGRLTLYFTDGTYINLTQDDLVLDSEDSQFAEVTFDHPRREVKKTSGR